MCFIVLQYAQVIRSFAQCRRAPLKYSRAGVAVCCSVLQCVAECCSKLQCEQIELQAKLLNYFLGSNKSNINQSVCCSMHRLSHSLNIVAHRRHIVELVLKYVAICRSVLQRVAACCSMLQYVGRVIR